MKSLLYLVSRGLPVFHTFRRKFLLPCLRFLRILPHYVLIPKKLCFFQSKFSFGRLGAFLALRCLSCMYPALHQLRSLTLSPGVSGRGRRENSDRQNIACSYLLFTAEVSFWRVLLSPSLKKIDNSTID